MLRWKELELEKSEINLQHFEQDMRRVRRGDHGVLRAQVTNLHCKDARNEWPTRERHEEVGERRRVGGRENAGTTEGE